MPGLPAPLAVLPPAAVGVRPLRLAPLPRPDALLRRRGARVTAVRPQPPFQLLQPQLKPPPQLTLSLQLRPQRRVLGIPRPSHGTQPREQLALPRVRIPLASLIRHAPNAPTPAGTRQIDQRQTPGRERAT